MGQLNFRIFGTSVEVRPSFWIVVFVLGISTQRSVGSQVVLALSLFGSILVHELGHAIAAKAGGLKPKILIHSFGGITSYETQTPLTRALAIRVTIAGPAAGIAIAALVLAILKLIPLALHRPWAPQVHVALVEFVQINAFWSVINLLPVMPFDGGQILTYLMGPTRRLLTARISIAFGCLAALYLHSLGLTVAAVVFFAASVMQYLSLKRLSQESTITITTREIDNLLEQARRALASGDYDVALRLSRAVVEVAPISTIRRNAAEVYAWAALGNGLQAEARQALIWMSDGAVDPLLQAAMLEADGDIERAVTCLRQARTSGDLRPQVAASLVRLLLLVDRFGEAALTTIQILEHVTVDEARQVIGACQAGGRPVPAAELAYALFNKTSNVDDLLSCVKDYVAARQMDAACAALSEELGKNVTPKDVVESAVWNELAEQVELVDVLEKARGRVVG
jgi:Zn-dependent protease